MVKRVKLQTKLLTISVLLTVIPLLIVSVIVFRQNKTMVGVAETESTKLAYADLDQTATNIYAMCQNQQKVVEESLNSALNTARYLFEGMG